MATGKPFSKTLIKYNSNNLEENDEEEKEPIDIEFTEQNADYEMMKMLLTLDNRMYKKKTRKILLWLTSLRACKSKLMRKFFHKSNWMIAVSYLMKRKIKKFFDVISNTKIFNIKFFSMKLPTNKILPKLKGTRQGGGTGQYRIRYIRYKANFINSACFWISNIWQISWSYKTCRWHIWTIFIVNFTILFSFQCYMI